MTKRTSRTRKQNQPTPPGGDELGWGGDSPSQQERRKSPSANTISETMRRTGRSVEQDPGFSQPTRGWRELKPEVKMLKPEQKPKYPKTGK